MPVFDKYPDSRLIGLSGTLGSGKDTGANILVAEQGFMHVSCGDILRAEASRREIADADRTTLVNIGRELRVARGMGALGVMGIEAWEERRDEFIGGLVISGLRTVGESSLVPQEHGALAFVDGPLETRYRNLQASTRTTGKFSSFEEFQAHEHLELHGLLGEDSPNLRAVQAIAGVQIWNDGEDLAKYHDDFLEALGLAS